MREGVDGRSPSTAILKAVADAKGVDPLELSPPLAEVINPYALNELITDTTTTGRMIFEYNGYEVTVHSDGTVDVDELAMIKHRSEC